MGVDRLLVIKITMIHCDAYHFPEQDGRTKLGKEMHERIKKAFEKFQNQREVARLFGISQQMVRFIINPEKYQENKSRTRKQSKEKRREYVKRYRDKKKAMGYVQKTQDRG